MVRLPERSTVKELSDEIRGGITGGVPWVTLTWAQAIDGTIALRRGRPTAISGEESLQLTHHLRAGHDAILVGAGTVLSDDPRLTTRFVDGSDARPVVLDRDLRTPCTARLFGDGGRYPIFFHSPDVPVERVTTLAAAGAICEALDDRALGSLRAALDRLTAHGICSVMVEGGGEVLAAFLAAGLADLLVITVAPTVLGGYRPPFGATPCQEAGAPADRGGAPRIAAPQYRSLGDDLIVYGAPG